MRHVRRILLLATMLMVVSVPALAPSAAGADPIPPYGCWRMMIGDESAGKEGALAGCRYGHGWARAIAYCMNDNGARASFYGPWVSTGNNASLAYCSSTYPYVYNAAVQTQAL